MAQLHREDLHEYQVQTVNHMVRNPDSMLWLGLGLGKTISTLSVFDVHKKMGTSKAMLV